MFGIHRKLKYISKRFQLAANVPLGGLDIKTKMFKSLFPENASLKCIATGFRFTEGPVWFAEGMFLLFSDIPSDKIFKLNSHNKIEIFRQPSSNSNGLTRDTGGRLIICEHRNRRVTRIENDDSLTILADHFNYKKLNSPNDIVVKSDGSIYFTDPPYGIKADQQEQNVQGVYRISPDGAEINLIAADFDRPNGLAFSPDEKKLYIDDSSQLRHIRVFNVESDGSLSDGRIFHSMNIKEKGAPDGMKVDSNGFLFCTGAGGVWVFDPKGNHHGTIITPENPSNCTWGDDDLKSLFITAETSVYKIRVNNPGLPYCYTKP